MLIDLLDKTITVLIVAALEDARAEMEEIMRSHQEQGIS